MMAEMAKPQHAWKAFRLSDALQIVALWVLPLNVEIIKYTLHAMVAYHTAATTTTVIYIKVSSIIWKTTTPTLMGHTEHITRQICLYAKNWGDS